MLPWFRDHGTADDHVLLERPMSGALRRSTSALGVLLVVGSMVSCRDGSSPAASPPPSTGQSATTTSTVAAPDAHLVVDDRRGVGRLGDPSLSVAEAIRLANGDLALGQLSDDERALVTGHPGRDSADRIEIDLPTGPEITVPEQTSPGSGYFITDEVRSALPSLVGNDGDHIDGGGAALANGNGRVIGGVGLIVSSSNVVIEDLTLRRFLTSVDIAPVDDRPLENIQLRGNRLEGGGGIAGRSTAESGAVTTVRGLVIADNELRSPVELGLTYPYVINQAISFQALTGAASPVGGGEAAVEDLEITGNVIRGFPNGLGLSAVTSAEDVGDLASRMSRVRIEGNDIEMLTGSFDPAIYLWGASNTGAAIDDVTIEDIEVVDNRLMSNGHVLLATASEQVLGNDETSADIEWDGLSIVGNTLGPVDSCGVGMMIATSFQEITTGSRAEGISLGDVRIEDNDIDCATGVILSPAVNFGSAAVGEGITLEGVLVASNRFRVDDAALLAAGGRVIETILGGAESSPDAVVRDNLFDGLTVEGNELLSGHALVWAYGGLIDGAPGRASANELRGLAIGENDVGAAVVCRAVADESGSEGGRASDNRVDTSAC